MNRQFVRQRRIAALFAVLGVLGLAGCGGIEFESKLLDSVGLSPKGLIGDGKHKQQKLETRSGIVIPPSTDALPVPGQPGATVASAPVDQSFPQNPETVAAQQKRAAAAKRKRDCDANNGAYGSRQSGQHSGIETPSSQYKVECAKAVSDIFGD